MWAAINLDNRQCTFFTEQREALLYVALKLKGYGYELPMSPKRMDTATLAAVVADHEDEDKAWVVLEAEMGEPEIVKEEEEEEEEGEEEEGVGAPLSSFTMEGVSPRALKEEQGAQKKGSSSLGSVGRP